MNRDRLTQLVAVLLAVVCLLGASLMVPSIDHQRRELQLATTPLLGENVPWYLTLVNTAAGSFRGILVDALWYRAEMLKRDGKNFEASSLADTITTLQPHFPQVWVFNGWNLAFNVSVQTHTPTERWDWVSKGERLLREQGVVYNPNSVPIYDMLSWIWQFKIGGETDDMHWYYKLRVAEEWQELLGAPAEGGDKAQALAAFKPLRDAADRYFAFSRPSHQLMARIDELAALDPELAEQLETLRTMDIERMATHMTRMSAEAAGKREAVRNKIKELLDATIEARDRSRRDPLTVLYEDYPDTRALVTAIREAGGAIDTPTTRRIGRLSAYARFGMFPDVETFSRWAAANLETTDQRMLSILFNPAFQSAGPRLMAYMRAQAMVRDYKMDPGLMYQTMEDYGPLDWRHPTSHSLYWAKLGVMRSGELRDRTKVDILNTYRRVIHATQHLSYKGRVNYDPIRQRISYQPDPRFIDSYIQTVEAATKWVESPQDDIEFAGGVIRSFRAGHENFLQYAVVMSYIYGERSQAQRYYTQLQDQYGKTREGQNREGIYNLVLDDFVADMIAQENEGQATNLAFINGLLNSAITQGLAERRLDVFDRFINLAKQCHDRYNELRSNPNPTAPRERLAFEPFPQMVANAYIQYMANPQTDLALRSDTYLFTTFIPALRPLVLDTYTRFRPSIVDEVRGPMAEAQGGTNAEAIVDQLFPRPPGLQEGPKLEQTPDEPAPTLQRQ